VDRLGGDIVVTTPFYRATVSPDAGGRIVSLKADGEELTHMPEDGHGGLLEELNTADAIYREVQTERRADTVTVQLAGGIGHREVVRKFHFSGSGPAFRVEMEFANTGTYPVAAPFRPVLRNLVLPAGSHTGRELYCLERGRGAQVHSAGIFAASEIGSNAGDLQWLAVSSPATRRAVGFSLQHAGGRAVAPLRTRESGLLTGWSYAPLAGGESLRTAVTVAVLPGFSTVTEMTPRLAAQTTARPNDEGLRLRMRTMALNRPLEQVSVVARPVDTDGREGPPCDAVLVGTLEPGQPQVDEVTCPAPAGGTAWVHHAAFARSEALTKYALPVTPSAGAPPLAAGALSPPPRQKSQLPPITDASREEKARGFVLRNLAGGRAGPIGLTLCRGERRTVFLGLTALRDLPGAQVALGGAHQADGESRALPAPAAGLWQVREHPDRPAELVPLDKLSLTEGQTAWFAVTLDASHMNPGLNSARVLVAVDGEPAGVPLSVHVAQAEPPGSMDFALWLLNAPPDAESHRMLGARFAAYGGQAVFLASDSAQPLGPLVRRAQRQGRGAVGLQAAGGYLPPRTGSQAPVLLPVTRPLWLVNARGAAAGTAGSARRAGFLPALLCSRLSDLGFQRLQGPARCTVVADGPAPGTTALAVQTGRVAAEGAVLLHLDLRGLDWRTAAGVVPRALWVAAWQGLAGVAVTGPAPARDVQHQRAVWHVLRDARRDAALWQGTVRRCRAGVLRGVPARRLRRRLARAIGRGQGSALQVQRRKQAFREVYALAPPASPTAAFDAAREALEITTGAWVACAQATRERAADQLFWDGHPMVREDQVRWAIVAAGGEEEWKSGLRMQRRLQEAGGRELPLTRALPTDRDALDLIYVLADPDAPDSLAPPVREALEGSAGRKLVTARLEQGPALAILTDMSLLNWLLAGVHPAPLPYAPAREVR
jgi:hypothetical protein